MAEKLKKYNSLRLTGINRMDEMLDCASKDKTDEDFHLIFKMRYPVLDITKDEFFKQHNLIISLISTDDQFKVEDKIRKQFEINFYSIKACYYCLFEA
ncbi:hypothetical protein JTB14_016910 [Gonioctena quinquepunctata]|nr:hypothetical protein JTB14_016910 [Gonioctena quinquepunctata]